MNIIKWSISILTVSLIYTCCTQNAQEGNIQIESTNISLLEKEIELRIREYERYLQEGDSIALGNMYTEDAEIIPTIAGRENITKVFSKMIQDSTIGTFETTHIWGNNELIVEEGRGIWSHKNREGSSSGRYLLVWKKDNGEWKILRDTWFADKKVKSDK